MDSSQQMALALFADPTLEQLIGQRGASELLRVEVNPRLRTSWQLKVSPSGQRILTIPPWLNEAPLAGKQALLQWATMAVRRRKTPSASEYLRTKKQLEALIWQYAPSAITENRRRALDTQTALSRGCQYDLQEVFDCINQRHFQNSLCAVLRWGAVASLTSYHSIRADRSGNSVNLITIAGVYNHPDVPRFAIESVMYHEMLHIAIPPLVHNGRRVVHGSQFKAAERLNPLLERWHAWERTDIHRIVRELRRSARSGRTPKSRRK
jgi:hypothetical protein